MAGRKFEPLWHSSIPDREKKLAVAGCEDFGREEVRWYPLYSGVEVVVSLSLQRVESGALWREVRKNARKKMKRVETQAASVKVSEMVDALSQSNGRCVLD
jgi:hypothetical protein